MPFLILLLLALTAGVATGLTAHSYTRRARLGRGPSIDAARKVGETARSHPGLRGALQRHVDPEAATGVALTIAMLATIGAGVVLGLLAYLVRTSSLLISIDDSVAKWGHHHASRLSQDALNGVTQLGSIYVIIGLCVVLAIVELLRTRSRWIVPFIVAVVGGEEIATTVIKQVVNRARPAFDPAAATLGPSFPSGHSATAAAFYAAAALLLGRRRPSWVRAALAGAAAAITVAVAASRVLLDVHWLTDVIAGIALGYAWFSICAIAFGGRILRFGTAAEVASHVAERVEPVPPQRHISKQRTPTGRSGSGTSAHVTRPGGRGADQH